jgi:tetratricopeptide (TPR) repeat protein
MDRPAAPPPINQPQPETAGLPHKPTTAEEFFERGCEFLRNDDPAAAMKDFGDSYRAKPDGRTHAFIAYCRAKSGNHQDAVALYQHAIRNHGYAEAWVHCNLSNSLLRCGTKEELRQAITEATIALEMDPTLRAARLNRAWAKYLLNFDPNTQTLKNPTDCLADLAAVMSADPRTADLYHKAALIRVAGGAGRDADRNQAVSYLREAVRLGKDPKSFADNPVFKAHLSSKDFAELATLTRGKPEPPVNVHVVDPLNR